MNEILHHFEIMGKPLVVGIYREIINSGVSYVVQDFVHPQYGQASAQFRDVKEASEISDTSSTRWQSLSSGQTYPSGLHVTSLG